MHTQRKNRTGFTFAELLIVVMILAIASALLVPLASNDQVIGLRAAAEVLAADIEDVQARTLADPNQPTCLVPHADGSGWHIGYRHTPGQPIAGIDGEPLVRFFGLGALASTPNAHLSTSELPETGLTFDDQGAPTLTDGTICFEITGAEKDGSFTILLSTSTGRVSIER